MKNSSRPKLAVVTGAASGVGLATAHSLQKSSTVVIGVDLAEVPEALASVERIDWVRGDVSQEQTWDQVRSQCLQRDPLGPDALIACAADIVIAPFLETSIHDWHRIFEINVFGVLRAMQTLLPGMLRRRQGAIAAVCSINSLYVEDQLSAYSTSKAALLHVVRSAALEYASYGIRINAVLPGFTDTPLLKRALDVLDDPEGARRAAESRTPTGNIVQPEEVAAVLCFLVSESASGMSGAAVTVDGGLTTAYDFDLASR